MVIYKHLCYSNHCEPENELHRSQFHWDRQASITVHMALKSCRELKKVKILLSEANIVISS